MGNDTCSSPVAGRIGANEAPLHFAHRHRDGARRASGKETTPPKERISDPPWGPPAAPGSSPMQCCRCALTPRPTTTEPPRLYRPAERLASEGRRKFASEAQSIHLSYFSRFSWPIQKTIAPGHAAARAPGTVASGASRARVFFGSNPHPKSSIACWARLAVPAGPANSRASAPAQSAENKSSTNRRLATRNSRARNA